MRLWISQAVISEAKSLLLHQLKHDKGSSNGPSFTNPVALTLQRTFDDPQAHCGKQTAIVCGVEYQTGPNFKKFMGEVLKGKEKAGYVTILDIAPEGDAYDIE